MKMTINKTINKGSKGSKELRAYDVTLLSTTAVMKRFIDAAKLVEFSESDIEAKIKTHSGQSDFDIQNMSNTEGFSVALGMSFKGKWKQGEFDCDELSIEKDTFNAQQQRGKWMRRIPGVSDYKGPSAIRIAKRIEKYEDKENRKLRKEAKKRLKDGDDSLLDDAVEAVGTNWKRWAAFIAPIALLSLLAGVAAKTGQFARLGGTSLANLAGTWAGWAGWVAAGAVAATAAKLLGDYFKAKFYENYKEKKDNDELNEPDKVSDGELKALKDGAKKGWSLYVKPRAYLNSWRHPQAYYAGVELNARGKDTFISAVVEERKARKPQV